MSRGGSLALVKRAFKVVNEEGVRRLVRKAEPILYDRLYPHLPETDEYGVYNGVVTGQRPRVSDYTVSERLSRASNPDYERQFVALLRTYVEVGDDVVVVGGGLGVSSVAAARRAGESGGVVTYEASRSEAERAARTVELNGLEDRVEVRHAIVGSRGDLRGSADGAEIVQSDELPACDVLALDCDGAELAILEALTERPSLLVVEHHGVSNEGTVEFEYRPAKVAGLLDQKGYEVVHEETVARKGPDRADETYFVARAT